jgi:hypothetical protein
VCTTAQNTQHIWNSTPTARIDEGLTRCSRKETPQSIQRADGSLRKLSAPFSPRSLNPLTYYFSHGNCPFQRRKDIFSDSLRAKLLCAETFWRQDVTRRSRRFSVHEKGSFACHLSLFHSFCLRQFFRGTNLQFSGPPTYCSQQPSPRHGTAACEVRSWRVGS